MGKPFRVSLVSDVRAFLKGTDDVAGALEDVAGSLDDVAAQGDQATDKLERSFSAAMRDIRRHSDTAGDAIGRDFRKGTRRAEDGLDELRDESASTAREAAASFTGSADDIVDAFQEIAANALAGFGPIGAGLGLALAAGVGLAIGKLSELADRQTANKERAVELAEALADVQGNPAAIRWADQLGDRMRDIVNTKEWWEVWQDGPETRLEQWSAKAREFGLDWTDVVRTATGDTEALARVQGELNRQMDVYQDAGLDASSTVIQGRRKFRDELAAEVDVVADATTMARRYQEALGGIDDAAADAADATEAYQDAVAGALDQAGQSWEDYTENGKVNLRRYTDAIEAQAKAIRGFEANLAKASQTLSAEALGYLQSLGPEAAPLLQAYMDAPKKEQKRAAAAWDSVGRASSDGYRAGLSGLPGETRAALDRAQDVASGNPLDIRLAVPSGQLQRDVYRVIGGIHAPTIMVDVRTRRPQV